MSEHKIRLYFHTGSGEEKRGYYIEITCDAVIYQKDLAWFRDYKEALNYARIKAEELNLVLIEDTKSKEEKSE